MLNALALTVLLAAPASADVAPSALNSLSSFPAGIVSAPVFDERGQAVGTVSQTQAAPGGKPLAISIQPSGNARAPVIVSAAAASYDQSRNMVVVSTDALLPIRNGAPKS